MNKELVEKVTGLVMEELQALHLNQTEGVVKIWPHQASPAKPIALTENAVSQAILPGQVRFSTFPKS
ncbi:hypothetical protein JYK21_08785 [Ralstonia pickettii]|nr:hypothetical protein [Ralstonia pickettii]